MTNPTARKQAPATTPKPGPAKPAAPAPQAPATGPSNGTGKKGRPKGSKAVEVDFKTLTIVDDEAPKRAGSAPADNPMTAHVRASWEQRETGTTLGRGKSVTVATEPEAKRVANLVRYAADNLKDSEGKPLGASVQIDKLPNGGGWKVRFAAKKRKAAPKPKPATEGNAS